MMTTQEQAVMIQALGALEEVDGLITALLGSLLGSPDEDAPGARVRAAITALRITLAQEQPKLTNEEIDNICRQTHGGADPQEWARNFGRAIERKVRE